MLAAGFETAIPVGERTQTQALDRAATGISHGIFFFLKQEWLEGNMKAYRSEPYTKMCVT